MDWFDWGIPTAISLQMARDGAPHLPLIASGGLRTGLDAAKAIALGAGLAGFAGPLLKAAATGETETFDLLSALIAELRLAMFCSGAATIPDLQRVDLIVDGVDVAARRPDNPSIPDAPAASPESAIDPIDLTAWMNERHGRAHER